MARGATKDLTKGNPTKLILGFAIPLLLGMLFQQFYGMVDTIIVGRYLGVKALAGVGSTGSINFLVLGFCNGVASGFALPIAQSFGARDYKGMRRYVTNSIWLSAGFAGVMTIVICLLCRSILKWMNTPDDVFEQAYSYILIIFLGIPAIFLYNLLAGMIRSLGDSRAPLVFLVLAAVLNILFDFISIVGLKMGVAGAAWATVLSQLISGLACLTYIWKKLDILHPSKDEWRMDTHAMKKLCAMGIPMGLQYSVTAIGSIVLQTAVNSLGSSVVAAMTAAGRISGFCCCPFEALGSTMATYSGQNLGARKLDRVKSGAMRAALIGSIYAVIAFILMYFFGRNVALLFLDAGETEILDKVEFFVRIYTAFFIPLCFVNVFRFAIQGLGYSMLAVIAGVCELVGRAAVALILIPQVGFIGACFASPAAWILADLFLIPAFIHCVKKLEEMFDPQRRESYGYGN